MKKDKNWLDVVKSSLKVLEDDISFLRDFDVSLPSEISNFLERMNSRYTSAIEKIVQEDESGYSDLEDILINIHETRLQQHQKTVKSMLQMTRKELKSAFWFKDQFSLSQRIDDIEKRILEIDAYLTSGEPIGLEKSINLYKDQINALGGIQNSFVGERRRSRFDISLKVVIWYLPIIAGITGGMWISGKINNSIIFTLIVLMFSSAVLSYLFVGSKRFEGVISQNKVILAISLFIALIIVIFSWQFYTPISSYFETKFAFDWQLFLFITATVLIFSTIPIVMRILATRYFAVVIPTIDENFSPGDEIVIPYSFENKTSDVITEIGVSLFAPGLSVLSLGKNILHKSLGGKSTENGELKLLEVPKEAVPGEYTVELTWSFYAGSEKYTKTNELKVNVVS